MQAPLLRHAVFIIIYVHNMLVQTIALRKLINVLHIHLLGRRQEETARWASDPRERELDLMGKKEDRACPSSFLPSDPSAIPTSTATAPPRARTGPVPRGTLVKAPSSKRAFQERSVRSGSRSQCGQSAPSRDDSACFTPNQTIDVCIPARLM